MNRVRRVHVAALIINGAALALVFTHHLTAAALAQLLSATLLVWSLEQLHAAAVRETRP